jgi:hypothetical protein
MYGRNSDNRIAPTPSVTERLLLLGRDKDSGCGGFSMYAGGR